MIAIAHFLAISCYLAAAALAAVPFARAIRTPTRGVLALLGAGVVCHLCGLAAFTRQFGQLPLTGMGASLSLVGILMALSLLVVELLARDVSLTLFAAPLAALAASLGTIAGLVPGRGTSGTQGAWLGAHIVLSFLGIAAFATAAAAGTMYLLEHRELKSRRFGAIFQFFPPLDTLDRVNHVAALVGWMSLTIGIVLAVTYSFTYRTLDIPQIVWGLAAWAAVTTLAGGRVIGRWQARRAAVVTSLLFAAVIASYLAVRFQDASAGTFL
jgi:ABC-type uncharacterized transport system permease subunit